MFDDLQMSDTDASSPVVLESARKIESAIMKRMHSVGQKQVAEAIGMSESTISKWVGPSGTLEKFCQILAFLDLKVAPTTDILFDPARLEALMLLAQDGVDAARSALANGTNGKKP